MAELRLLPKTLSHEANATMRDLSEWELGCEDQLSRDLKALENN